jgi:hypothetical protein
MMDLERGRVAHAVPGRVRIKLDPRALEDERGERLRRSLLAVPDVEEIRMTPRSGSIVLVYDPDALTSRSLIARLRDARLLALDPPDVDLYAQQVPLSDTAQGIRRTFTGVNARLSEITDGKWDLRSVVPFAFGALALRSLIADPAVIGAAPWYVLAWYAFDSFWKLNQDHVVVEKADDLTKHADGANLKEEE